MHRYGCELIAIAQVHIVLPPLAKLRTVIERLKTQSDIIGIRANRSGRLQISVSTDNVKTDVCWTKLSNPSMGRNTCHYYVIISTEGSCTVRENGAPTNGPRRNVEPEQMVGVLVSIKSFLKFLNSHVISTTTIACQSFHFDAPLCLKNSSSPRYMPESLHYPVRLHRRGCGRRRCPHVLHPDDCG